MNTLEHEIKVLIISALELEDIQPEHIDVEAPLFSEGGLALDSIDALELGVALKKKYHIKLEANEAANKEHFRSVATLARFVERFQKEV